MIINHKDIIIRKIITKENTKALVGFYTPNTDNLDLLTSIVQNLFDLSISLIGLGKITWILISFSFSTNETIAMIGYQINIKL